MLSVFGYSRIGKRLRGLGRVLHLVDEVLPPASHRVSFLGWRRSARLAVGSAPTVDDRPCLNLAADLRRGTTRSSGIHPQRCRRTRRLVDQPQALHHTAPTCGVRPIGEGSWLAAWTDREGAEETARYASEARAVSQVARYAQRVPLP